MSGIASLSEPDGSWVVDASAVFTPLGEGAVVLDLRSKRYFQLNGSGRTVWSRLARGKATLGELVDSVCAEYDVDRDTARNDVRRVVAELTAEGLIHAA